MHLGLKMLRSPFLMYVLLITQFFQSNEAGVVISFDFCSFRDLAAKKRTKNDCPELAPMKIISLLPFTSEEGTRDVSYYLKIHVTWQLPLCYCSTIHRYKYSPLQHFGIFTNSVKLQKSNSRYCNFN